jgi:hypothetical protein
MSDILGEERIAVRRTAAGSRDSAGRYVPGAVQSFWILGSVQPISGRETLSLPEGERSRDWRKVYTRTQLRPVETGALLGGAGRAGDRVVIDGEIFEVRTVQPYRAIIPHYRADCVRVQEGGA